MKRIEELDKEDFLGNIEASGRRERGELKRRMEELILREDISWNQKAKSKGVIEWDNNSKLFHRIASGRKVNKLINKIENAVGVVLQTENEIVEEITSFFENLYKEEERVRFGVEGLDWPVLVGIVRKN